MSFYQVQQWERLGERHGYWRTWSEEYSDTNAAWKAMGHQRVYNTDEFRIVRVEVIQEVRDPYAGMLDASARTEREVTF